MDFYHLAFSLHGRPGGEDLASEGFGVGRGIVATASAVCVGTTSRSKYQVW